ncbi:MAG: hypothetical protein H5T86_16135, partial [Armatimonadetes bacterium]|nr:hypothetical protein [Armatimonadota bacterium]
MTETQARLSGAVRFSPLRRSLRPTILHLTVSAVAALIVVWAGGQSRAAEIVFQAWDYQMPGERQFYDDLIAAFHQAHPDVKVSFALGQWADAHKQIAAWI